MALTYRAHVENIAWQPWVFDGQLAGTVGQSLRMEAIEIDTEDADFSVKYRTHVENQGWGDWVFDGVTSGTTGLGLRLEAIEIMLDGKNSGLWSVWYRVHVQNEGFGDWFKDGETAGTVGEALRAEAIQIIVVPRMEYIIKDTTPRATIGTKYRGHIENMGWKSYVMNGVSCGTTGYGLRMEAIELSIVNKGDLDITVAYAVHSENIGWSASVTDGVVAGTVGQSLRMEAFRASLAGADRKAYSIWYRGHVENQGWTDWFKDGEVCGTEGQGLRLESLCIVILLKDDSLREAPPYQANHVLPGYRIYATNYPESQFLLHETRVGKVLTNMVVTEEENKAGTFVFDMLPDHENYEDLVKKKTEIDVYEIGADDTLELIFSGRVTKEKSNYKKIKTVSCEGELAYLLDSQQRPRKYENNNIEQWLTTILDNHNVAVTQEKRFYTGVVTVNSTTDDTLRENDYINTLDLLYNQVINSLGGVFYVEYIGGLKFLNYMESGGVINPQIIRFGQNLLDVTQSLDADDIITAVIPVGKATDGVKLTIASVNNGSDYVYNEYAVNEYGWIFETVEFPDIEDPTELMAKGVEWLDERAKVNLSISLNAFDLSLINVDAQRIRVGDSVRCISTPHGIDGFYPCVKKVRNLQAPDKDRIVLGKTIRTFTEAHAQAIKRGEAEFERYVPPLKNEVGMIGFFASTAIPSGWLKADGTEVSRTDYSGLFDVIGETFGAGDESTTFNLPDLRGMFVRGFDDGAGVDIDRVFGDVQQDEIKLHTHTQALGGSLSNVESTAGSYVVGNANTSETAGTGGTETRPKNVSLMACIKY